MLAGHVTCHVQHVAQPHWVRCRHRRLDSRLDHLIRSVCYRLLHLTSPIFPAGPLFLDRIVVGRTLGRGSRRLIEKLPIQLIDPRASQP